jgi:hypothetical protein
MAVAGLALVVEPTPASGDDADAKIQAASVELKTLEVADKDHVATAEIGKAEALRDKARSLVGAKKKDEEQALAWSVDELQGTVALIRGKIQNAEAKAKLEAAKKAAADKQAEIATTKAEAEKIEKETAEVAKKIGGGK